MSCVTAGVNTPRKKIRRKIPLFEEHIIGQWVTNVWAATLTPSEYLLVSAIQARTVAWGKMWEVIPVRHLIDGIHGKNGVSYHGVGLSKPTILKALDRLVAEGYILRRALGKTRSYALNLRVMGTEADPGTHRNAHRYHEKQERKEALQALHKAQRAAIVKAEAQWRATQDPEDKATWMALLGTSEEKVTMLPKRRTGCAENTNENSESGEAIGKAALPINRKHKASILPTEGMEPTPAAELPRKRVRVQSTATTESTEPTPEHWKQRTRRTRRHVATTEENIPVLRHAVESEDVPATTHAARMLTAMEQGTATGQPVDTGLTGVMQERARIIAQRNREKMMKKLAKPDELQEVWARAITRKCAGYRPTPWRPRDVSRMKQLIRTIPMPDPAMRWGQIMDWVATNFGEATSLAIPFMLKKAEKREEILQDRPSLSLFMHFASEYVHAYATLFHGRGFTAEEEERARLDNNAHNRAMQRVSAIHQNGYDNLPRQHMHNDELEDVVRRLAQDDDMARAVLEERDEHRTLVRQFRRRYGAGYRQILETHLARERRRIAMEQDPDQMDHYPTHDFSDE